MKICISSVHVLVLVFLGFATHEIMGQTPALSFRSVPLAIPTGTQAFGDFNEDGKQDAVGLDARALAISVYPGNGDGTFAIKPLQTPVGGNPEYSLANSRLILANVHNRNPINPLSIAFSVSQFNASGGLLDYGVIFGDGLGNGYFALCETDIICLPNSPNYSVAPTTLMLVAADFLKTGNTDIAFATQFPDISVPGVYDNSFMFYKGFGAGTFAPVTLSQTLLPAQVSGTTPNPSAMAADFLNNGYPYLLVNPGSVTTKGVTTPSGLSLGMNNFQNQYGTFTAATTILPGVAVAEYLPIDVNADKKLDIVYTETVDAATPSTSIKALLGDGAGNFGSSMNLVIAPSGITGTLSFSFVDLNNDGKVDLVFSGQSSGLYWAAGNGDGTFNTPALITANDTLSTYAASSYTGFPVPPLLGGSTNFAWGQKAAYIVAIGPKVLINPASPVSFGSQYVGTISAPKPVTLTNTGDQEATISSVGTSAGFTAVNGCGSTLAPNASCTVIVSFAPTTTGPQSGTLTVTDNTNDSPHGAKLTGTGTSVTVGPASGSATSSTISSGGTATYVLAVSPVQGFAGSLTVTCDGAPSGYQCVGSQSRVTLDGTSSANVTFTVRPATTAADHIDPLRYGGTILLASLLVGFLPRSRRSRIAAGGLLLVIVVAISGCGGSNNVSAPVPVSNTYALSATFTPSAGTSITQPLTLTITSK